MNINQLFVANSAETGAIAREENIKKFFETASQNDIAILKMYIDPDVLFHFDEKSIKKALMDDNSANMIQEGGIIDNILTDIPGVSIEQTQAKNSNQCSVLELLTAISTTTGQAAIDAFSSAYHGLSDDDKYVVGIILTKKPTGVTIKNVNKVYNEVYGKDFVEKFQCQLANKYEAGKNYGVTQWLATPKMDGLRCVFRRSIGKVMTRENKQLVGFDKMVAELSQICEKFDLNMMDGELYSHGFEFSDIASSVTSNKNIDPQKKEQIFFNCFIVVPENSKCTSTATIYNMMDEQINEYMAAHNFKYVRMINCELIDNNPEAIKKLASKYVEAGYEGVMLRNPDKIYDYRRSDALLKFKFFTEHTFTITGKYEGKNKYAGMLGGIYVKGEYDGKIIESEVGSGFTEDQRKEYWVSSMNGVIAEIKFQGISKSKTRKDDVWSLRFPTFLKIRTDITEA